MFIYLEFQYFCDFLFQIVFLSWAERTHWTAVCRQTTSGSPHEKNGLARMLTRLLISRLWNFMHFRYKYVGAPKIHRLKTKLRPLLCLRPEFRVCKVHMYYIRIIFTRLIPYFRQLQQFVKERNKDKPHPRTPQYTKGQQKIGRTIVLL